MINLAARVVAHLGERHTASCAQNDPWPGACDCDARPVPLVTLADAQAAVAEALRIPPSEPSTTTQG